MMEKHSGGGKEGVHAPVDGEEGREAETGLQRTSMHLREPGGCPNACVYPRGEQMTAWWVNVPEPRGQCSAALVEPAVLRSYVNYM
jgi:hypothetical protein